ncbi:MAG: AraC family transcriptional regulator [Lentisphaeria bacterium]|nr:AraC family transcriptional regulator [Lentisphaeria bacterium]
MKVKGKDGFSFSKYEMEPSKLSVHTESWFRMHGNYPLWFGWTLRSICRKGWYFKHYNATINSIEIPVSGTLKVMRQDREYILPPGHALILPEGEDNLLSADTSLDKIAFGVSGSLAVPLIRSLFGDYFQITGLNCAKIQEYYRWLAPLLRKSDPADIPKISGIGMELLYYLASHLDRSIPAELLRAVEIMNYNSGRRIRISDIAAECGLSDYQLSRLVLKHYGMTPKQYLMRQKIQKCCALLKDSQDRIKEISASAGYADMHVFSKEFKKRCGMTPRQFRKQMREKSTLG